MPRFVIDDSTPNHVLFPRHFGRGYDADARAQAGYAGVADPFPDHLLIPRSEWQARIEEKVASKTQISDLCDQANLPCLNQEQTSFCWVNGPTYCTEVIRAIQGQSRVLLSPASVGGPITGYRDVGGWAKPALEYIAQNGIVPQDQWPANAIDGRYHTDSNVQLALGYRVTEWWDLNGGDVVANLVSCLLHGFPVAVGFNWWSHVVSAIDPVWQDGEVAIRIRNSWGCYDEATEILTRRGWLSFRDLQEGEVVATLNPQTHELEYQAAQELHTYDYEGDLWHFQAQGVDLLVTPNHRLYIGPRIPLKGVHLLSPWRLVEANRIDILNYRMKKDALWCGHEVETHSVGRHEIPMDLWLEFLGYFLSEGCTTLRIHERPARSWEETYRLKNGIVRTCKARRGACVQTDYYVRLAQNDGPGADVIAACLARLPFHFKRHGVNWGTNNKALWEELSPFGKAHAKRLPDYVRELSRRQQSILLDALMLGDGHCAGPDGSWKTYYTSSRTLADDVQELALKAGYAADIMSVDRVGRTNARGTTRHVEYQVTIKSKRREPAREGGWFPERVPYRGKVYCVTVPNHIVYVRRRGQAVWCGNSSWQDRGYAILQGQRMVPDDAVSPRVVAATS